jgi:serine protease Do
MNARLHHLFLASFLTVVSPSLSGSSPAMAESADPVTQLKNISEAFNQVAEKVTPQVVSVSSFKKAKDTPGKQPPSMNDPFFDRFREFFGDDMMERFGQQGQEAPQQGLGSGVIVDARGYILTNNHVLGKADEVEVTLSNDPKKYKAEVVGVDPRSDLAVIKITPPRTLKGATLGDSDSLKIGDWVIAAGNPFGLTNTITAGIVSAKGRSIGLVGQYEDFIQTDAAINPGNSGGPLVDLNGEIVGINTAIFTRSGGYMGVGFAIPSNMARSVMNSLIEKGRVIRGWLGVGIQNLTEELSESFQHTGTEGALVGQIQDGGPAAKAGVKQGDIITAFNGTKIKDVNHLRNLVAATAPGTKSDVEVLREGKKEILSIKIEELPAQAEQENIVADQPTNIGITVETLTPELAARLGTKKTKGVIVSRVLPGSIAQRGGLQVRDIIISVNGKSVSKESDFLASLSQETSPREFDWWSRATAWNVSFSYDRRSRNRKARPPKGGLPRQPSHT